MGEPMPDDIPDDIEPELNGTEQMPGKSDFVPPLKPRHVLLALGKWLAVLIIVAALIIAGIWIAKHHKSAPARTATTQTHSQTSSQTPLIASSTTHYDSSNLNLGLDYPSDWKVNDTASLLTITSPTLPLQFRGGTTSGQIVLSIQPRQTSVAQFAKGTAVAVKESQRISYKQPTPDQRAQTYVTFVSYSGSTDSLDALYITGDNGYQVAQSVPASDIEQDDPLVSIGFLKCADAACKTSAPAPLALAAWSDTRLSQPLITLLESLAIN